MELLAPAGNIQALRLAVANGADAVYLGYTAFSARAGADNFDEDKLSEAIAYCHLYHVKVYVTLNTLVKEAEIIRVRQILAMLLRLHADGVIVQDLGVASLVRQEFSALRLHASTQMSLHNASGVRFAKAAGFDRVVLARECALSEIRLAAQTGLEVEVFVHGALCVCVSGQCLFSSMLGNRSGNRGRCAQPCRMAYRMGQIKRALLSPRDLMLRDHLDVLGDAGVTALKIEGRLKRPEYVAVVTAAYRKALDELKQGRFRPAAQDEREALYQVFNRGGFMPGYAMLSQDAAVIEPKRVNHGGLPMGKVIGVSNGLARIALTRDLHDQDGLQFRGAEDEEAVYSGPDTPQGQTALCRLRPVSRVQKGDEVARLSDAVQLKAAEQSDPPVIDVDMALTAMPNEALRLSLTDGDVSVTVTGVVVNPAQTSPLTIEGVQGALAKIGGTCFALRQTEIETQNAFVPVSVLNALRRQGLEQLKRARIEAFQKRMAPTPQTAAVDRVIRPISVIRPQAAYWRGPGSLPRAGTLDIFEPEDYRPGALEAALEGLPQGTWLALPVQCREETLTMLHTFASRYRQKLGGVVLGSVGQLGMGWPVKVAAGPGIPVMNRKAAQALQDAGCAFMTASVELSEDELNELKGFALLVLIFGRVRLMVLNHCPARTALGLNSGREACRLCDEHAPGCLKGQTLVDRIDARFPLTRTRLPEGCLVNVMNGPMLDLTAYEAQIKGMGFIPLRMVESTAEGMADGAQRQTTLGHWRRPVE